MANNQNYLNLTDAASAAGIARKTLYRHIERGEISVTRHNGKRVIDVSELIRKYGNVSLPDKKKQRDTVTNVTENATLDALVREVSDLRSQMLLLLEDKEQRAAERQQLLDQQKHIEQLTSELEAERSRSGWSKIFRKKM